VGGERWAPASPGDEPFQDRRQVSLRLWIGLEHRQTYRQECGGLALQGGGMRRDPALHCTLIRTHVDGRRYDDARVSARIGGVGPPSFHQLDVGAARAKLVRDE
jgi:hypothetical protein